MSLTNLDKFEKVAQTGYMCMTAFAGEWWLKDNYVAQEYQPEAVALTKIMAVLILCASNTTGTTELT